MLAHLKLKTVFTPVLKIGLALFVLSLSACTKSKEVKSMVSPDAYVTKADYEGKVFSLVRGIEEADSNNVVGAIPGFSQDYGLVTVRITETEVQFIEHYNLSNKPGTQSILASYEIKDHFDIQREQNDFGETTNKIVENKERPWNQRKFMRVDWAKPTNASSKLSASTDQLDLETENVVLLADPVNEGGHISWLTEFSAPGSSGWWGVQPNSRVVARTHLMPLKTTDFQPVNYRNEDFKRFGYFFTQQDVENPEKGLLDSEIENVTYAHLFNVCEPGRKDLSGSPLSCSTGKVVWHLTKNYPEKYLAVTRQAVKDWNETFKVALGRGDDVVVLDESKSVDMVDPRFNTIAHYGAKSPGGLLGVAQKASNPITGEVIAARATVYEDGVRGTMGWVDSIITMILEDEEIRQVFLATDAETKERLNELFRKPGDFKVGTDSRTLRLKLGLPAAPQKVQKFSGRESQFEVRNSIGAITKQVSEPVGRSLARKENLVKKAPELFATSEQSRLGGSIFGFDLTFGLLGARSAAKSRLPEIGGLEHLHDVGAGLREERARMVQQAATGIHGAELVEEATLRYIKKVLAANPDLKDFRAQVEAIKREVEQKTYYSTLLHELGHTFGLRHNFHASADEKHYHPEFHRLNGKLEAEAALPPEGKTVAAGDLDPYMFSSIMDYGGDFYSQIGGLAPYDVAAIRYAYNRSIDKKTDPAVTSGFKFCTDHQVNESILCRRFDKGRNVSEITFNLIEDYQTNWVLSHMRRDRATFEQRARSYPMGALVRYFIPVRQVMDEFLFALIDSKSVPAKENECDIGYWRESVDKNEIVNVCNFIDAEQAGVDPTSLETFEMGLFGPEGLRMNPQQYTPYGLADLAFANILAKQFFVDVLGSTEPGMYIAEPLSQDEFQLQKLPDNVELEKALEDFASGRGIPTTPDVMAQLKSLVGEVKIGRYGKPFISEWDESGPFPRQTNIGSFWDKYIAMVALGIKDMGIQKYSRRSMSGNAYAFPHTQEFSRSLFKSMITDGDRLVTIPLRTPLGVLPAKAAPSTNLDVKSIATITALTDFISDSDESMADLLRVCSTDESGCRAPFDQNVAQFTSASGQHVYRATQTTDRKSISHDLVSAAAKIDAERKTWVERQQKASDADAVNIMKVTELADAREALEKNLKSLSDPKIDEVLKPLLSTEAEDGSMWTLVNVLATQSKDVPLFLTINLADQAGGILNATGQILSQSMEALDPTGRCKEVPAAAPGIRLPPPRSNPQPSEPLPPGVGRLRALLGGTKPTFRFQELTPGASSGGSEAPAIPSDCAPVIAKRAKYTAAALEFQSFATEIGGILSRAVEAKASPLRVKRLTDDLSRAETNIKLIRKISKAAGLD